MINEIYKNYSFLHVTDREIAVREEELGPKLKTAIQWKIPDNFITLSPLMNKWLKLNCIRLIKIYGL